jgi:hypothetical protein
MYTNTGTSVATGMRSSVESWGSPFPTLIAVDCRVADRINPSPQPPMPGYFYLVSTTGFICQEQRPNRGGIGRNQ